MVVSLMKEVEPCVLFNRQDHGFIDVHIPSVTDSHPNRFAAIFQQFSAQRHLNVSQCHLQNYRLSDPRFECLVHSWPLDSAA